MWNGLISAKNSFSKIFNTTQTSFTEVIFFMGFRKRLGNLLCLFRLASLVACFSIRDGLIFLNLKDFQMDKNSPPLKICHTPTREVPFDQKMSLYPVYHHCKPYEHHQNNIKFIAFTFNRKKNHRSCES